MFGVTKKDGMKEVIVKVIENEYTHYVGERTSDE